MFRKTILAGVAGFGAVTAASFGATAGAIPYPNPGTPNPVTYTFTAAATGDVMAYFGGSTASYDEEVGMLDNGVSTGVLGLDDHSSTIGQSLDLGHVTKGDTLTFSDDVFTIGTTWYSNPSMNSDGGNHVYSTFAAAGQVYTGSPAGTYVAFEDLVFPDSDYNYFDDTFVFTNVSTSVPEPASWALMLIGVGAIGAALRAPRRKASTAA
jgi:hypothetical protein